MIRKSILIIVILFLVIFLGYYYISGLPHYTFYLIYKSVKNHDVESFYKYVDIDSIIDNFMNDAWKEAMQKNQADDEYSALGMGLAQAMKPMAKTMLIDLAKQEITNAIEDIKQPSKQESLIKETPVKLFLNRFKSLKEFSNIKIRTNGKVTEVEVPSAKTYESLTIKMRKTPHRYWKIVAIQLPYISDIIKMKQQEDISKANEEKITLEKNTQIAIHKKINLPPVDLEKINDPYYISYYQIVREKIRRSSYQMYSKNEKGEVYVSFVVYQTGELKDVRIDNNKTKCSDDLKELAIISIKGAAPFPEFPVELQRYRELNFKIILSFETE
jgi:hypothetical protein